MKKQIQMPLLIISVVLFVILVAELLFLFVFKKNKQDAEDKIKAASVEAVNGLEGLYKPATDDGVKLVFESIDTHMNTVKPLYKTGVLKELLITETYKSVVTKIEKTNKTIKGVDGKTLRFIYDIRISNLDSKEKKERGYLLGQEEIERIEVYKAMGKEEIEISLDDIKVGDFISITSTINFLTSPDNNINSMKIVKLL